MPLLAWRRVCHHKGGVAGRLCLDATISVFCAKTERGNRIIFWGFANSWGSDFVLNPNMGS